VKLNLKNPYGQDFSLVVPLSMSVGELKQKLSLEYPSRPAVAAQKIIFAGRNLDNHQLLSSVFQNQQIEQTQTLHLVISRPNQPSQGDREAPWGNMGGNPYHGAYAQPHANYPNYNQAAPNYYNYPPNNNNYPPNNNNFANFNQPLPNYPPPPQNPPEFNPNVPGRPQPHAYFPPPPNWGHPQAGNPYAGYPGNYPGGPVPPYGAGPYGAPQVQIHQIGVARLNIDLSLILKLIFLVFILGQGGGPERLGFLTALAICYYLYQTGVARIIRVQQPPADPHQPQQPQQQQPQQQQPQPQQQQPQQADGQPANPAGSPQQQPPPLFYQRPGATGEILGFVVPLFCSLFPSWQIPEHHHRNQPNENQQQPEQQQNPPNQ